MNKRKISRYNPMSKGFQEDAKILGLTGNQLIQKYIREEKLPDPTIVDRECNNNIYQSIGYKDKAEYLREWRHTNGIQLPMDVNTDCAHYLGTIVAERQYGRIILPEIFGGIEQEMPYGNPWYDFLVKRSIKVDVKSCCLREMKGWIGWEPHVRFNNITDYFLILAFDDRENLHLMHIWLIIKDEIIRGDKFYNRDSIKITNKYRYLLPFKRFDWIDKLECYNNMRS